MWRVIREVLERGHGKKYIKIEQPVVCLSDWRLVRIENLELKNSVTKNQKLLYI